MAKRAKGTEGLRSYHVAIHSQRFVEHIQTGQLHMLSCRPDHHISVIALNVIYCRLLNGLKAQKKRLKRLHLD